MVDVSVIVPVYLVEEHLRECLHSILSQDHRSLEVIAVNDASPDGSLRILQDYAARDGRLKIVDLPVNRGLGAARNAGISAASGRWLWFVDSDDWIQPGAIAAAVGRARQTGAEVVIFDYRRVYPDGRVLRGGRMDILADAPERFTVGDYPEILELLQIACNKLIERSLIDRLDLSFVDGWYEDTPFSYPLLVGARSITALPRPLLNYRQRAGAITRSVSARHFEVLRQWERAMEHVLSLSAGSSTIHTALTQLMVRHCTTVLLRHERIPAVLQDSFVRELRRLFKRHHPERPYKALSRLERVQHLILPFASVRMLQALWRLTFRLRWLIHRRSAWQRQRAALRHVQSSSPATALAPLTAEWADCERSYVD